MTFPKRIEFLWLARTLPNVFRGFVPHFHRGFVAPCTRGL